MFLVAKLKEQKALTAGMSTRNPASALEKLLNLLSLCGAVLTAIWLLALLLGLDDELATYLILGK